MIFSRKSDDALASLVKKLDAVVADGKDKQFKTFVSFIGESADALKPKVEKFAKDSGVKEIPLTIAVEQPDGPESYGLNEEATYTVLIYKELKVAANHALKEKELTKEKVEAIVKDAKKLLE